MALPRKGLRKITVEDQDYHWIASGNDGWIDLFVESRDKGGRLLSAKFEYHHAEGDKGLQQQFVVTPGIVSQVILHGKSQGWNPEEKGKPFDLGQMDDKIELGIKGRHGTFIGFRLLPLNLMFLWAQLRPVSKAIAEK